MEPSIQYAQTADGVSIAFSTLGDGAPLVYAPLFFSHIQLEWQFTEYRRWYQRLAAKRMLIRYDGRGTGLSDRNVADYSLDANVLDLEAVVDRLGLERFALFGFYHTGLTAIVYAVRHPERVTHLILWHAFARASDYVGSPQVEATHALLDKDWELFTETIAHDRLGWSQGEPADQFAALMRECVTPEYTKVFSQATPEFDITALLPQLRVPTLLLHRRQYSRLPVDIARGVASRIPEARLVLLEGASLAPYLEDTDAVVRAIYEFLGEEEEAAAKAEPPEAGAFRTVLFTDVEGSTALTQRLGDARAREVLREHERMVREALKAHGGWEVKTLGDGFMASFSSATKALECAIAMQRAFAEHNESAEEPVRVRVGLNAGEPIVEEKDLFGTAVIVAARIAAKAESGEILTSDTVRGLVAGKGFLFSDRGETALRGFEDPVRLYEVTWRGEG
jgi:class 3 adenylate cyclase